MLNEVRASVLAMMALFVACAIVVLVAPSCRQVEPGHEHKVREAFLWWRAQVHDTTTLRTFLAGASSDSGSHALDYMLKMQRMAASATLAELGYAATPYNCDVQPQPLRSFQRDLGLPVTGAYDSATISQLTIAVAALQQAAVTVPPFRFDSSGNTLSAQGTWEAGTDTLDYPINAVDIVCERESGKCVVVRVDFISSALDQIALRRYEYFIRRWDRDALIADDGTGPDRDVLSIGIPAQSVTLTETNPADVIYSDFIGRKGRPVVLTLVDGSWQQGGFPSYRGNYAGGDRFKPVRQMVFGDRDRFMGLRAKNLQRGMRAAGLPAQ